MSRKDYMKRGDGHSPASNLRHKEDVQSGSREVPFEPESLCESCGKAGAFDFMGDLLCGDCAFPDVAAQQTREGSEP